MQFSVLVKAIEARKVLITDHADEEDQEDLEECLQSVYDNRTEAEV